MLATTFILLFGIQISSARPQCCASKKVGEEMYTLVGTETGNFPERCIEPCMYTRDDEPGDKYYCFAKGSLKVECTEEGLIENPPKTPITTKKPPCKKPPCKTPPPPPPPPPKSYGPYGSLISATTPFSDAATATGLPTKILIYAGPAGLHPNVIVGIQVTYGDVTGQLHGRKTANVTTCIADPKNDIYFAQFRGHAIENNDTSSFITQLGVFNNDGNQVCLPNMFAGSGQTGKSFNAPAAASKTTGLGYIKGKVSDTPLLGQLTFVFKPDNPPPITRN